MIMLRKGLMPVLLTASLSVAAGLFTAETALSAPPDAPMPGEPGHCAKRMEKFRSELHEKLNLTPQQESAWKTFTEKTKLSAPWPKGERSELTELTTPERMERMLNRMKEFEGRMAERLAAVKEFYAVLTPEQRKVFDEQFNKRMAGHHDRQWR